MKRPVMALSAFLVALGLLTWVGSVETQAQACVNLGDVLALPGYNLEDDSSCASAVAANTIADGDVNGLIAAIQAANAVTPTAPITIELAANGFYTLTAVENETRGPNGLPTIVGDIIIAGHGATIARSDAAGTPQFRIFRVEEQGRLALAAVTLRGGDVTVPSTAVAEAEDASAAAEDRGIKEPTHVGRLAPSETEPYGGAIYNWGVLTVDQSTITHNAAEYGGGIENYGVLTVTESVVSDNTAQVNSGGIENYRGTLALFQTRVSGNNAGNNGGGIANGKAYATLVESEVSYNSAARNGGGLHNYTQSLADPTSVLILDSSTVMSNTAVDYGGGICNVAAHVTLNGSLVVSNTAGLGGAGVANTAVSDWGDAIATLNDTLVAGNRSTGGVGGGAMNATDTNQVAVLNVNRSIIRDNVASSTVSGDGTGGGIHNTSFNAIGATAIVTVTDSTVSSNQATNGGGLGNGVATPGGGLVTRMTLVNSTVSGNQATAAGQMSGNGGGIFSVNSQLDLVNSTVSGNIAQGDPRQLSGIGGGIANVTTGDAATARLLDVTVADNEAGAGGGIGSGAILGAHDAEVILRNTLVAGNQDQAGSPGCIALSNAQGQGVLTSQGYNLESADSCQLNQPTDQVDVDPVMGPLADNGGPTKTHALLAGSPAVNAILTAQCMVTTDQRGVGRPQSAGCDVGAYEAILPVLAVTITGPTAGVTDTNYAFQADVLPIAAATPITYVWQMAGQADIVHTSGVSDTVTLSWSEVGAHEILVTASNVSSVVTDTHRITIAVPTPTGRRLYLPLIERR